MFRREYAKVFQGISSQEVWKQWVDIDAWPKWHDDLEFCKLKGSFQVGSFFTLKPRGIPAVQIEITSIDPGRSFTDLTRFPGAKMFDTHSLRELDGGLEISNTLEMKGPLSFLWFFLVGRNVAKSIPSETENLIKRIKGSA